MRPDPLADLLSLIEPTAMLASGLRAGGRWAIGCDEPEGLKFFAIVEGMACLQAPGHVSHALSAGDIILFNGKQPHMLASGPDTAAVDTATIRDLLSHGGIGHIGDGDTTTTTTIIGGRALLNRDHGHLLHDLLPPLIRAHGQSSSGDVLGVLIDRMTAELHNRRIGRSLALPRLAQLVILELVRDYLERQPGHGAGWLGGIADARIGPAIALIHDRPAHRWTVNELARAVGMSRTAFALRFKQVTALSPMAYLIKWRMHLAENLLLRGDRSVAAVGRHVGYASEGAFSHAFKRERGLPPSSVAPPAARAGSPKADASLLVLPLTVPICLD